MKYIATILLAAVAISASGQRHIEATIDRLSSSGEARQVKMLQESDAQGQKSGGLTIHKITDASSLDAVLQAFDSDASQAYYAISEQGSGTNRRTTALNYGSDGESVLIGKDRKSNYRTICFVDPDRDDFRYAYAVEWTEDGDGNIDGRIISTYGKRPNSSRSGTHKLVISGLDSLRLDESDLQELRELGPALRGVIGSIADVGADVLDGLKENGIDVSALTYNLAQDPDSEFTDDVSWLTAFNHYRNALLGAAKRGSSSTSAYATSLLKLCKQAHRVRLTDNEKSLCLKSLKEMRKATHDTFVRGLLDEAAEILRRPNT